MNTNGSEAMRVEALTQNKELLLLDFLQRVKVKGISAERLCSSHSLTGADFPHLKSTTQPLRNS